MIVIIAANTAIPAQYAGYWRCAYALDADQCGWHGIEQVTRPSWQETSATYGCPRCGESGCIELVTQGYDQYLRRGYDVPSGLQVEERWPGRDVLGIDPQILGVMAYYEDALAALTARVEALENAAG